MGVTDEAERSVERLVQGFAKAGRLDSSGEFTLSLENALSKLADFQLAHPRHYVLNFLSSAVLSGARRFEAQFSSGRTVLSFDGEPFAYKELEDLFSHVLNPRQPRLQEMGVALLGLVGLSPKGFSLVSAEEGQAVQLCWRDGIWSLHRGDLEHTEPLLTSLTVEESFSITRTAALKLGSFPEREALEKRACFAPLELLLNRSRVSKDLEIGGPSSLALLYLKGAKPRFLLRPYRPDWTDSCKPEEQWSDNPEWQAALYMDRLSAAGERKLQFFSSGVLFELPQSVLEVPFVSGAVAAPFRKDLSHASLAEDENFRTVLSGVRKSAEEMVLRRMLSPKDLSAEIIAELVDWAPELLSRFVSRGDSERQGLLRHWMEERRFLSDLKQDSVWRSLLSELAALPHRERLASARRLRRGLVKAAREYVESCDFETAHSLCLRIQELLVLEEDGPLSSAEQGVFVTSALLGRSMWGVERLEPELLLHILRLHGRVLETLEMEGCAKYRGFLLLANGELEESFPLLEELCEEKPEAEVLEALSDLSLLSARPKSRGEALRFRLEAIKIRAAQDTSLEVFLWEDLPGIARRSSSFTDFIYWRSRVAGSLLTSAPLVEFQQSLRAAENSLKRGQSVSGAVITRSALVKLEKSFPLASPYQGAARSRAAHLLRRYGYYRDADQILARGYLFDRLLKLFASL